jgi:hypothetical protein
MSNDVNNTRGDFPAPRCPDYKVAKSVEDLMPYFDAVARREYMTGLHVAWDLKKDERILLQADNWHDPICIEAARRTFERFGCKAEIQMKDRGPIPIYRGHDEVEIFRDLSRELSEAMDQWEEFDQKGLYDKVLWGFGGPILSERKLKIQRFPFITPEMVMSAAHTYPVEILKALDLWTWDRIRRARSVHFVDPEGTDLWYTARDEYFDSHREFYNEEHVHRWWPQNEAFGRTYLPGHIWGKPSFLLPPGLEDGHGVIAGTMNHIGPFPRIKLKVEKSLITEIEGGGEFGDKLRNLQDATYNVQYPGMPGKGLLYWWEASIGTNPKIHRPRDRFLHGWICAVYERMRSGIVHLGYGTIISSELEREAVRQKMPHVGHFHVHLNYPTVDVELKGGGVERVIDRGRLRGLDDPEIRKIAAKYGDPDQILREDWIPATPGINVDGNYQRDYASQPEEWTAAELLICQKWHHLYMKMVGAEHSGSGDGCGHSHG